MVIDPPRFPALDPEPPPAPLWRRVMMPTSVVAVAVAIAAAVLLWPLSRGSAIGSALSTTGVVVVWRESGSLAVTDPDGSHPRHATRPQSAQQYPVRSPDARYAVDVSGDLWSLSPAGVRRVTGRAWGRYMLNSLAVQPFAGMDRYLVIGGKGAYGEAVSAQLRDLRSGRLSRLLGPRNPDGVAGDPAHPGVYVTDPVGLPVAVGSIFHQADRLLEYITVDGKRRTLLTDGQARRLLRMSGRVELFSWPSADGSSVAVVVKELTGSASGVILLKATGGMEDSFPIPNAPDDIEWSPSGALVIAISFPGQLLVRAPDGGVRRLSVRLPAGEHFGGDCQWSPDSAVVLCPTFGAAGVSHWLLDRIADDRQRIVPAPGLPVAWIGAEAAQ